MTIPATMNAIAIEKPGGPEVLIPTKVATPAPRKGEVLIKVHAAGVNRPDVLQRLGKYLVPKDADPLPGLEISGEVAAVGEEANRWQVGDRVCALTHGGGYAEYCRVQENHCLPIPHNWDWIKAAATPETFFTVWTNVFDRAELQTGESILVHGGSSGIGTTAIQLARAYECRVIVTAGSDEKCEFCVSLGAHRAINYKTQDWPEEVMKATDDRGVDVVLDMVAGPYVQKNIDVLAADGRYALIAFLKGFKTEINLSRFLRDRLTLTGSTLRPQSNAKKAAIADALERNVWPLIENGRVAPVIYKTYPLNQAHLAHELMESSTHMGKIVLTLS